MVALALGVAKAKSLPRLPGALNGARAFGNWANTLGYETHVVTDDLAPVTIDTLRAVLQDILEEPIARLILYFAGHGLIREAEQGLWLLTDWLDTLRAVHVELLKRNLYRYPVDQISIISDACRSSAVDITLADLTFDGVLNRGPKDFDTIPPIDKFVATLDGAETYMIPGKRPAQHRCLFSGVLMEGLWGIDQTAFDPERHKVTSRSLAAFLEEQVPARAKLYGRAVNPQTSPLFRAPTDIYLDSPPPMAPQFAPWPDPDSLLDDAAAEEAGEAAADASEGGAQQLLEFDEEVQPVEFYIGSSVTHRVLWRTPDQLEGQTPSSAMHDQLVQSRPPRGQVGFFTAGTPVRTAWTPKDVNVDTYPDGNWRQLRDKQPRDQHSPLSHPAPLLFELDDHLYAAATALPNFAASLLSDARGVSALVYHEIHAPDLAYRTEDLLAEMEDGALRADQKLDLAADLREFKHVDPVLGVISSYLYDSIGDIDSIRRMASFYVLNQQPIPYDVAMLATLRGRWKDGLLFVDIPAVPEREPRTDAEKKARWTHCKTDETSGVVGGLWPWLRQGWDYVENVASPVSPLNRPDLVGLRHFLTPARFTTFNRIGGRRLISALHLVGWKTQPNAFPAPEMQYRGA
jgi:hypothetical protein